MLFIIRGYDTSTRPPTRPAEIHLTESLTGTIEHYVSHELMPIQTGSEMKSPYRMRVRYGGPAYLETKEDDTMFSPTLTFIG